MSLSANSSNVLSYGFLFDFEKNFKYRRFDDWLKENWTLCFPAIVAYVLSIFAIQRAMSKREPLGLRTVLFVWNLGLALFSTLGAARMLPEITFALKNFGLRHAICVEHAKDGAFGFWLAAFVLSKFVELGDTLFIVLRKQPLIFLHWFHHISVLFSVCHNTLSPMSTARWYMATNYTIHALMYSYYAARSRGMRFPKVIPLLITSVQLAQMVLAIFVSSYAWTEQNAGRACAVDRRTLIISFICYGSYFVLFANFFIKSYLSGKRKGKVINNNFVLNNNATANDLAKKGV